MTQWMSLKPNAVAVTRLRYLHDENATNNNDDNIDPLLRGHPRQHHDEKLKPTGQPEQPHGDVSTEDASAPPTVIAPIAVSDLELQAKIKPTIVQPGVTPRKSDKVCNILSVLCFF
jgi:hypothetical protein